MIACSKCLLEIVPGESKCLRCGGTDFYTFGNSPRYANPQSIRREINAVVSAASSVAKTRIECMMCDYPVPHFMVVPLDKDGKRLTTLPQCPLRVWRYGNLDIGKKELMEELRVR